MSAAAAFISQLVPRRSIYALSKDNFPVSQDEVIELVKDVVKWTPTSFNSQSTRAVVLFGDHHDKLWNDITLNALKAVVPADQFAPTEAKIKSFAAGYGTVLWFEDTETVKGLQEKFPLYAEGFPEWASHSSGAAQINTWTALAELKVGANLQHYNALIADAVAKQWNVPTTWRLTAQLVFGSIAAPAGEKTFIEDTVKAFK